MEGSIAHLPQMKTPTHPTRRASARTPSYRGIRNSSVAALNPLESSVSSGPSATSEGSLEVTFCTLQRVRGHTFLLLCTRSDWRIYNLNSLSMARENCCSPVQLLIDPKKDAARVSRVRFFRLFEISTEVNKTRELGALFVSKRSAPLPLSDKEDEDFVTSMNDTEDNDGHEDIAVLNLDGQKLLYKLPPSPSLVLDVQTNATTAAVLCETHELFLYNLATFQLQQTLIVASPAMALGPRWLAYSGFTHGAVTVQANNQEQSISRRGDDDSDFDDVPIEALGPSGMTVETRDVSHNSSPTYTAINVAQNVASGLYYLSEVGRATIAPYLSSSPGTPRNDVHSGHPQTSATSRRSCDRFRKSSFKDYNVSCKQFQQIHSSDDAAAIALKKKPGWVVVFDLITKRILANFPCHSTALVNLSLDFSGLLLATSSTKGQNLHVYRLSPPLQSVVNRPNVPSVLGHGTLHYQLVYKLQRGITHASIQDIAFSQDGKWINVTSAHGTSHLYALHPEGARISADTHANIVDNAVLSDADELGAGFPLRQVNDFYADFRALETRTHTQVLRIRHDMKVFTATTASVDKSTGTSSSKSRTTRSSSTSSSSSLSSTSSSSSPPGPSYHSSHASGSMRNSILESALDASHALLSQLATSAIDFGYQHFENDTDVESRRRRLRQRLCCLFAPDGLKMFICCDSTLKLYGMCVTALSQHKADHARATLFDSKTKKSKSSLSSFGFEASITELKSWDLLASGRRKSDFSPFPLEYHSSLCSGGCESAKSELRTFAQRSLPLWAHPKVSFRAFDDNHPEGRILEIKRKRPNPSQESSASTMAMAPEGYTNGDEQLFVMEMDSYFGIGGSPVFDGHSEGCFAMPEVPPPLDLATSINMAILSSLPETPPKSTPEVNNTICFGSNDPICTPSVGDGAEMIQREEMKVKSRQVFTPSSSVDNETAEEDNNSDGLVSLQYTMQDMYFAAPAKNASA